MPGWVNGKINRIAIEATKAITPPSLFGIDRKIAYANKKYHSGWIWTGVTNGLAGMKLSGSPSMYGLKRVIKIKVVNKIINPKISLNEKYGWNGILSMFLLIPNGLFDPVWCKNRRWIIVIAATIKGKTKCKVKNRVKVALSIANPPQIHCTKSVPKYGIADNKFVITVAPQKDICPQGRTYPIKAVAITANKIRTPIDQVIWYK